MALYNITCNAICPGYFDTDLTHETLNTEAFKRYMKLTVTLSLAFYTNKYFYLLNLIFDTVEAHLLLFKKVMWQKL